jgi:hypothetical protein
MDSDPYATDEEIENDIDPFFLETDHDDDARSDVSTDVEEGG